MKNLGSDVLMKTIPELDFVLQWAKLKLQAGQEPPWAWYQYMKLVEAIEAIQKGNLQVVSFPKEGEPIEVGMPI